MTMSRTTPGSVDQYIMERLIPLEAYREEIASLKLARLGFATGLLFAALLFFGLSAAVSILSPGDVPWLLLAVVTGVAGVFFGFVFPRALKRNLLRATDAIYAGAGHYATSPPEGPFSHSVPGSLVRGRLEIGGVLYLGRQLATFVPHSLNLPRDRQSVALVQGGDCSIRLVDQRRELLALLLGQEPSPLLEIESLSGAWRFRVPQAARLVPAIQEIVRL